MIILGSGLIRLTLGLLKIIYILLICFFQVLVIDQLGFFLPTVYRVSVLLFFIK